MQLKFKYMPDDHFMVGLWISCLEITSVNQILDCLTLRLKSIINEQDTSWLQSISGNFRQLFTSIYWYVFRMYHGNEHTSVFFTCCHHIVFFYGNLMCSSCLCLRLKKTPKHSLFDTSGAKISPSGLNLFLSQAKVCFSCSTLCSVFWKTPFWELYKEK